MADVSCLIESIDDMLAFVLNRLRKRSGRASAGTSLTALALERVVVYSVLCFSLIQCSMAFADSSSNEIAFFESKIRPLLIEHCYECHSTQSGESGGDFRIDTAAAITRGGATGRAINQDSPDESLLLKVIQYDGDIQMPPEGRLNDESIAAIQHWLELGAPDPRTESDESAAPASPLQRDPMEHWAYNIPKQATAPAQHTSASRDILDDLAAQVARPKGIRFTRRASDESLIRRLYHDLSGLPPTQAQIEQFVNASQPDKYERLVDGLIAAPAFAERFARHWLDLARYADTIGYATAGKERVIKGSHRFRDWVIDAFARDIPYDEMVLHQLAADRTDPTGENGHLDAMGLLTIGRRFLNRLDTVDDRIDVISRGLLGMTVACARCHDHKFDPIPTKDYYSLFGILDSSRQPSDGASPLMMTDKKNPGDRPVLIRGQAGRPGEIAPRQYLTAFRSSQEPRFTDGSGRWELANRIASPDNPLLSRVFVNRVWGYLIGKPLVDSTSDFGFRTLAPPNVALLDDLAADFASDFSVKRLVRRIVLTHVYQQSSSVSTNQIDADPSNEYLCRANPKRRDFESLRDSMLHVAGMLDRSIGGPSIDIAKSDIAPRRTVYALINRQNLPALFRTFDFADPNAHAPKRYQTTVPQQALFLMNSPQLAQLARATAGIVRSETDDTANLERIARTLFKQVLQREPSTKQLDGAVAYLGQPVEPLSLDVRLNPRQLWSYGIGKLDAKNRVTDFQPLEVFQNSRYQFESAYPSGGKHGYASLLAETGHTPRDTSLAVVRRFTAPVSGVVRISGQMGHRSKQGDGVRISIIAGEDELYSRNNKSNNIPFSNLSKRIEQGQTVDIVASAGKSDSFDSFFFRSSIQLIPKSGKAIETNSVAHFSGPIKAKDLQPLDRLEQLAQVLLVSNEFMFVD